MSQFRRSETLERECEGRLCTVDDEDERACATGTGGEPALLAFRPFPFSFVFFVFFLSRFSFFSFGPTLFSASCCRGEGYEMGRGRGE